MWARGICAAVLMMLSGCDQISDLTEGLADRTASLNTTTTGIRTIAVLDGAVQVGGPEGYCIDPVASDVKRGYAVLAGCPLVSGDAEGMPDPDGLVLIQVGDAETASVAGNEDAFAAFLGSDTGRSILASNGDSANVAEVSTVVDRGAVLAHFEDTSGPSFVGTSGALWRGFLDVQGRLTTVSVLSFDRNPLSQSAGERLLVVAMAELADLNAAPVQVALEN